MAERTVAVDLTANVSNYLSGMSRASSATAGVGKQAQSTGELTRSFISKVGGSISSLGGQIGGSFGEVLSTVGSSIDQVSEKSVKLSAALQVGGAASVAAGIGLQQLASGEEEATAQLDAAIKAQGLSVSDYTGKIDEAVKAGEQFGFGAEDTKGALTTLTTATGSVTKATDLMSTVTNLAAARHESLADASTQVARILAGSGARTLVQYGITMDGVGSKTDQGTRALDQLSDKLSGQASASVDSFGGKLGVLKTKVSDFVDEAAGPAGQVLTALGGAATVAGVAIEIYKARAAAAAVAQTAMNASAAASVVPLEAEAAAATAASAATGTKGLLGTVGALATGPLGFVALAGAAIYGASALGSMTDAAKNNTLEIGNAADAAKAYNKQVALVQTSPKGVFGNSSTDRGQILQETSGVNKTVGDFFTGIGLGGLNPAIEGANASVQKIDASMASLVQSGNAKEAAAEFDKWQKAAKDSGVSVSDLDAEFPTYLAAVDGVKSKTDGVGTSFTSTAAAAKGVDDAVTNLSNTLNDLNSPAQAAIDANASYQQSISDVTAAAKTAKGGIDQTTAAGSANAAMLADLASKGEDAAAKQFALDHNTANYTATLQANHQEIVNQALAFGATQQQADDLANSIAALPTSKQIQVVLDAETAAAQAKIDAWIKKNALNTIDIQVQATTPNSVIRKAKGGLIGHFASGGGYGLYQGPGSGTSDSIPAMVSNGEYINTAATVARLGVGFFQKLNQGGSPGGNYQAAPIIAPSSTNIYVTVPITQSLVGNEDYLAKTVTTVVQKGLQSGTISPNWNSR